MASRILPWPSSMGPRGCYLPHHHWRTNISVSEYRKPCVLLVSGLCGCPTSVFCRCNALQLCRPSRRGQKLRTARQQLARRERWQPQVVRQLALRLPLQEIRSVHPCGPQCFSWSTQIFALQKCCEGINGPRLHHPCLAQRLGVRLGAAALPKLPTSSAAA